MQARRLMQSCWRRATKQLACSALPESPDVGQVVAAPAKGCVLVGLTRRGASGEVVTDDQLQQSA